MWRFTGGVRERGGWVQGGMNWNDTAGERGRWCGWCARWVVAGQETEGAVGGLAALGLPGGGKREKRQPARCWMRARVFGLPAG